MYQKKIEIGKNTVLKPDLCFTQTDEYNIQTSQFLRLSTKLQPGFCSGNGINVKKILVIWRKTM